MGLRKFVSEQLNHILTDEERKRLERETEQARGLDPGSMGLPPSATTEFEARVYQHVNGLYAAGDIEDADNEDFAIAILGFEETAERIENDGIASVD